MWRQSCATFSLRTGRWRPKRFARFVPEALEVQEFDGVSWIGVVPFRMTGVMRRGLPDMPYLSAFPELNVRTYVERDGNPACGFLVKTPPMRWRCGPPGGFSPAIFSRRHPH